MCFLFHFFKPSIEEKNSHGKSYSLFHLFENGQDVLLVNSSCVKKKMLPKPTLDMLPYEKQVKLY